MSAVRAVLSASLDAVPDCIPARVFSSESAIFPTVTASSAISVVTIVLSGILALAMLISVGNVPLLNFAIVTALSAILTVVTASLTNSDVPIALSATLALVIALVAIAIAPTLPSTSSLAPTESSAILA